MQLDNLLDAARLFCAESHLSNVTLLQDDFFATQLEEASFDLVHLRFQLCPIGRVSEQMAIAYRLLKPGVRNKQQKSLPFIAKNLSEVVVAGENATPFVPGLALR